MSSWFAIYMYCYILQWLHCWTPPPPPPSTEFWCTMKLEKICIELSTVFWLHVNLNTRRECVPDSPIWTTIYCQNGKEHGIALFTMVLAKPAQWKSSWFDSNHKTCVAATVCVPELCIYRVGLTFSASFSPLSLYSEWHATKNTLKISVKHLTR